MLIIGLTGGIASGKSLVSKKLQELGAIVIDADQIARQVVEPGRPALTVIVKEFGRNVLNAGGTLNRQALGRLVFADQEKLRKLNEISHPYIWQEIGLMLKKYQQQGAKIVILEVPLLFEVGWDKYVDFVWVVAVDPETQIQRLMARDNLTRKEALIRISSQMSLEEKIKRADRVIDNSGKSEETLARVQQLWTEVCGKPTEKSGK